jgi:sensor histidine kinase regulating citrate/malate metabolism
MNLNEMTLAITRKSLDEKSLATVMLCIICIAVVMSLLIYTFSYGLQVERERAKHEEDMSDRMRRTCDCIANGYEVFINGIKADTEHIEIRLYEPEKI